MFTPGPWAERAIAHVARTATGGPLDRSLRVTLNFHPDRLLDGATVLERLARDGRYLAEAGSLDAAVLGRAVRAGREDPPDLERVWHCVARSGAPVTG